ncbi:hypothetical protein FIU87_16500 [Bacillus sp. THAF10]|uniref:hypothetical protein n=1 Tax=Bacillus sp. THAF10 TaxID=2587848 RepID=UPI001268BACC|nr:hypothetical protein [Bacillus sp. THAF10]QFT90266.1 hypothetical protein FIU87_16500 [Bacillus sp. THAF10]
MQMQFIQEHLLAIFLIFLGAALIYDGWDSYRQMGVSTSTTLDRFKGVLFSIVFAIIIIFTFYSGKEIDDTTRTFLVGIILSAVATTVTRLKRAELHLKKYEPKSFFQIFEKKLESSNYQYTKKEKANDEYISSNYITHYYMEHSDEVIKVNWKDLDKSSMEVEFKRFRDKELLIEIAQELRDARPQLSYFKFNKISLIVSVIFMYVGFMMIFT